MGPKVKSSIQVMATKDECILMSGPQNNLPAWMIWVKADAREKYGNLGTLCDSGIEFVVPAIIPSDYMPEEEQVDGADAIAPLGAAAIARLREGAILARNKDVRKYNELKPKFFAYLWKLLSPDSAILISAHTDYDAAYATSDCLALWRMIMYTHLTHVHGSELEMVELTRSDEEDKHRDLKQGSKETIGEFIARLKNSYIVMVAAGIPVLTKPQKAVQFLKKLDQTRHGAMFAELRNNAQRGVSLPQSLLPAGTASPPISAASTPIWSRGPSS